MESWGPSTLGSKMRLADFQKDPWFRAVDYTKLPSTSANQVSNSAFQEPSRTAQLLLSLERTSGEDSSIHVDMKRTNVNINVGHTASKMRYKRANNACYEHKRKHQRCPVECPRRKQEFALYPFDESKNANAMGVALSSSSMLGGLKMKNYAAEGINAGQEVGVPRTSPTLPTPQHSSQHPSLQVVQGKQYPTSQPQVLQLKGHLGSPKPERTSPSSNSNQSRPRSMLPVQNVQLSQLKKFNENDEVGLLVQKFFTFKSPEQQLAAC